MGYKVRRKPDQPLYRAKDTGRVEPGQTVQVDHATFLRLVRDQPDGFDFLDDLALENPTEAEPGWTAADPAESARALRLLPGIGEVLSQRLVEAGILTPGALRDPANRDLVSQVVPEHILAPLVGEPTEDSP